MLCVSEIKVFKIWLVEFVTMLITQLYITVSMVAALGLIHRFLRKKNDQNSKINYF